MKTFISLFLFCFAILSPVFAVYENDSLTYGGQTVTSLVINKVVSGASVNITVQSTWSATSSVRCSVVFNGNVQVSNSTSQGQTSGTATNTYTVTPSGGNQNYILRLRYLSNVSDVLATKDIVVNASTAIQPQTVSISPNTAQRVVAGSSVVFTASGGNTTYQWSATGGTITGGGSTRTFTAANVAGAYSISVYAVGSGGYSQSNTASCVLNVVGVTSTDPTKKTFTYNVTNPFSTGTIRVTATDAVNGQVLGYIEVAAGDSAILQVIKVGNNAVNITAKCVTNCVSYIELTDGLGSSVYGAGLEFDLGALPDSSFSPIGSSYVAPVPLTPTPPLTAPKTTSAITSATPATPSPTITAANVGAVGFSTAATTDPLSDKTFKEGVGAMTTELQGINKKLASSGGGSGGAVSDEGTHTRLDTVNENLEKLVRSPSDTADAVATASNFATSAYGDSTDSAKSFGDGLGDSISSAGANLNTGNPFGSKTPTPLNYQISSVAGKPLIRGFSIDLNPLTSSAIPQWVTSALSWMKAVIAFTAVGMLWIDTNKQTRSAILSVLAVKREGSTSPERAGFAYLTSVGTSALGVGNLGTWAGFLAIIGARLVWFAILSGAFVVAIPAVIALLENVVFDDFNSYHTMLVNLQAQGGAFGSLLSMVLNLAPIATLTACFLFRMISQTLISAGLIPLAVFLRLISV